MKSSQPYAAPTAPPPTNNYNNGGGGSAEYGNNGKQYDTAPFSQATEETGPRFRPKKRLNDVIPLVLFIAAVVGFAVVSGISINTFIKYNGLNGGFGGRQQGGTGSAVTLNYHTVYLFLITAAVGLLIACLWLLIVRTFTKIILEITLALTVLLNIAICIYYYYIKYWSGAIIFTVIALLSVFFYWSMRKRIPLARILLQTTIDITKHHPVVYLIALIGLVVQTAVNVWYTFTVIAIYVKWTPNSPACVEGGCSSGKVTGLIFYATFAFIWISQVVGNVILTTLAGGIFGGWYYYGPRQGDSGLPRRASLGAFIRSTTLSLGSIAFGSLIVTILELIRIAAQMFHNAQMQDGDLIGQILSCCAVCLISCVSGLVQFFNKYAYIEIALYGKPYIQAAKDTWGLMKDRGIDALINDSLVGSVIMWGSYLNGFLCGLFAYLYLRFTNPPYNADGDYSAPIILYAFLMGIMMGSTLGSVIDAGVSTIFVGLGEDPQVLAQRSPGLFDMIAEKYPHVLQGVPRH